jgi:hypothetical protein
MLHNRPDGIITVYARGRPKEHDDAAGRTETSCILVPDKSDSHGARKNRVFIRRRTDDPDLSACSLPLSRFVFNAPAGAIGRFLIRYVSA